MKKVGDMGMVSPAVRRGPIRFPGRPGHAGRIVRGTAVVALVAGVLTTTTAHVSAAPEQVLQTVRVGLAADGTVSSVRSTAVRRTDGEDATSQAQTFDPADVAGDLPVRVQTAYRLGDRAGTDLSDLAGRSGTAVIQVTVQNVTVEPQSVSSGDLTQTALVGTPMSVVASAHLGGDGLAQVVTGGTGPATDGVLGQGADGDVVQWTAVLAPPRLSPTTTFTLVLTGDKLAVPTFDIAVQPRFVADASFQDLLQTAFDPQSASSTVALQRETAETITKVNDAIRDAGTSLALVQQQLNSSAASLGQRTYGALQASTADLGSRLEAVASSLDQTDDELASSLGGAQRAMVDQLKQAVDFMKQVLGDPARTGDPTAVLLPPDPTRSDCVGAHAFAYPRSKAADLSIYQHVKIAQATLTELVGAGHACAQRIQGELMDAIGAVPRTPEDVAACARSASAVCAIVNAEGAIASAFGQIDAYKKDITDAFSPEWLTALEESVPAFVQAYDNGTDRADDGIEGEIAGLTTDKGDVKALTADLEALRSTLEPVSKALADVRLSDVYEGVDAIATAVQGLHFADTDAQSTQVLGKILTEFCADAGGTTVDQAISDILTAVGITSCADVPADPSALVDRLGSAITAIGSVQTALAAMPSQTDVQKSITDAAKQISRVDGDIADLEAALAGDSSGLVQALAKLKDDLGELTGLAGTIDGTVEDIRAAQGDGGTIATALDRAFQGLAQARTEALGADGAADAQGGTLGAAEQRLAGADASSSRSDVSARVQALVQGMSDVQHDVDDVTDQTARSIGASRAGIDARYGLLAQVLGKNVMSVVRQMDKSLGGSVSSMTAAEKTLTDDLKAVLTGIGSPTGTTGLIGAMRDNANKTNDQVLHISTASDEAAAVGARRSVGADQQRLEWQQFSSVISAQASFPAFHLDGLSPDSTTLSVFTFHIGKD